MYVIALATDYDGTLAEDGVVSGATIRALERFRDSGRRLIMVTGRELPELQQVFPRLDLFERVVAENGALLFDPANRTESLLAPEACVELYEALKRKGATPLSIGRCIVATREPWHTAALDEIKRLGLELEIIFNKGAVMILPSGVNKATGLTCALKELRISRHNVVGVGDAENDHAFLQYCGCDVAVANALPSLRDRTHLVMQQPRGRGVVELIKRIEKEDCALMPPARHEIVLGRHGEEEISIPSFGKTVLIAGRSGIGKSTMATAVTEQMAAKEFQFCVFDPEGDYRELEDAVCAGDVKAPPAIEEIFTLLDRAGENVVINTLAIDLPQRPVFFSQVLPKIVSVRARLGRPHWLIVDEAHHILPAGREDLIAALPFDFGAAIFITVHPETVAPQVLKTVETVIALGPYAPETITAFCEKTGRKPPSRMTAPGDDEVLFWRVGEEKLLAVKVRQPRQQHKRHTRKYAEGALSDEESFYFRGPEKKLNLKAQNTSIFLQVAQGIDDETWEYHLRKGEYSRWFRTCIKDADLADEAAQVERDKSLDPQESRARIAEAINTRYTAPAHAPDQD